MTYLSGSIIFLFKIIIAPITLLIFLVMFPFRSLIIKRYKSKVEKYINNPDSFSDYDAYIILSKVVWKQYLSDDLSSADLSAKKLLELNKTIEKNWNSNNAIHHSHTIQGLVQLDLGNIQQAQVHLIKSGRIEGSPQLDSFGPTFNLAHELLTSGERDVVLEYLQDCSCFWSSGRKRIKSWVRQIKHNEIPEFPLRMNAELNK